MPGTEVHLSNGTHDRPFMLNSAGGIETWRRLNMLEHLTAREIEVAALVAQGLRNSLIAKRLCVEVSTVETHVHNILAKLGVATRAGIVAWYLSGRQQINDSIDGVGRNQS